MISVRPALLLLFSGIVSLTGCRRSEPQADDSASVTGLVEDGTDANEVEAQSSALTASSTLGATRFDDPREAAQGATNARALFLPSGCATAEVDPADDKTVVYTFNGCTGPWGLRRVTGKVKVTYSVTTVEGSPSLKLEVTGEDLQLKRASGVDFHATATLVATGVDRKMVFKSELSGTSARGKTLTRTASWTRAWRIGEPCISLDGTSEGSVGSRTVKTTVERYQSCRAECPAAGGVITLEGSATVRVEFTGEAFANITRTGAAPAQVALSCGAQ